MHRVARRDLDAMVVVALATAPALTKSKLKSKLPHVADEARRELAERICNQIDNDSYMVIVTDMVAMTTPYPRRGKWGVDEPPPAVVPQPPRPPEGMEGQAEKS